MGRVADDGLPNGIVDLVFVRGPGDEVAEGGGWGTARGAGDYEADGDAAGHGGVMMGFGVVMVTCGVEGKKELMRASSRDKFGRRVAREVSAPSHGRSGGWCLALRPSWSYEI